MYELKRLYGVEFYGRMFTFGEIGRFENGMVMRYFEVTIHAFAWRD
jgi:hypothetical protein